MRGLALRDGTATGEKGGVALRRTANMPSRPTMVVNVENEQTLTINPLPRNAVTIRR